MIEIARADPAIDTLTAQTVVNNVASRRVLEKNGFEGTGKRVDPQDGQLDCWAKVL
jgi:RimJ/RimL family protein N-acetyltransferase